jgi:ABC-type transport system substrate-binding protein
VDFNEIIGTAPDWGAYTVWQPLVTINASASFNTGVVQVLPALAQSWTVSASGLNYTVSLRQGVRYSNGDPFNCYQVWTELYGIYYINDNSSDWVDFVYSPFNMSNVDFGPASFAILNQTGLVNPSGAALQMMSNNTWPVYCASPYELVFILASPFPDFMNLWANNRGDMYDSQWILEHGGWGTPTAVNSYINQHPIPGPGPYMFTTVAEDSYVELTQNPYYWGDNLSTSQIAANPILDPGHVKNVIINYKPDDLTRYTDLGSGTAQIATILQSDWNLVLANPNQFGYLAAPPWSSLITFISLNTAIYPMNITDFRQAIVHAINYSDIISQAFLGQASLFVGPEYPVYANYSNLADQLPYEYNLTMAQQYLNESGITDIPTLTLPVDTTCAFCLTSAQIIQADLSQIGINVNVQVETNAAFFAYLGSYSSQLQNAQQLGDLSMDGTWGPIELTPADPWSAFVSNESLFGNYADYYNPTVQTAVNAFFNGANISTLLPLLKQAQVQLYNDAPYAAWFSLHLWDGDGSIVYDKSVINSFYADPIWTSMTDTVLYNTVTFT